MAGKDVLANGLQNINYEYKEPLYDINELRSIAPTDLKQQFDIRSVIDRIVDGSEFDEFKKLYGTVRTYPLYFFICLTIILISMGCYGMTFFLSAPVHLMICHTLIGCWFDNKYLASIMYMQQPIKFLQLIYIPVAWKKSAVAIPICLL